MTSTLMSANPLELTPSPMFLGMNDEELSALLKMMESETFGEGETILSEGISNQILWVIIRGKCEVVKTRKDGGERRLATLERGSVFGEMSFFQPAPHSASVRTLKETETLRLWRPQFEELEDICPSAAFKLATNAATVLAQRLRKMDEWTCQHIDGEDNPNREEWQEFRAKLYTGWQF